MASMRSAIWTDWNYTLKEAPKNQDERRQRRDNDHLDAAAGVDGIEAFFRQCVANGATILKPLTPTAWGTKDFYVEDPTATSSALVAVRQNNYLHIQFREGNDGENYRNRRRVLQEQKRQCRACSLVSEAPRHATRELWAARS